MKRSDSNSVSTAAPSDAAQPDTEAIAESLTGPETDTAPDTGPDNGLDSKTASDGEPADERVMPIDPAPRYLDITDLERKFITELNELVATPRATKRLVNTYRLVKATKTPEEPVRLEKAEHQSVLLMLAMQSGHPEEATEVFRALNVRKRGSWWAFVDQWQPKALRGKPGRYHNHLVGDMSEARATRWRELHRAMKLQQAHVGDDDISTYVRLWPSVARFGFTTGRAVTTKGGR